MLLGLSVSSMAQDKKTAVYMFGFSASFNDSIVYLTDIQKVEDAWVESKNGFLVNRDDYSYQLQNYLKQKGEQTPTCVTFYALKQNDIHKKYENLKKKYTNKKHGDFLVTYLKAEDFSYTAVTPDEIYPSAPKEPKKKESKKMPPMGDKPMGPPPGGNGSRPPMP